MRTVVVLHVQALAIAKNPYLDYIIVHMKIAMSAAAILYFYYYIISVIRDY